VIVSVFLEYRDADEFRSATLADVCDHSRQLGQSPTDEYEIGSLHEFEFSVEMNAKI
jgi:hypothetical protein